MPLQIIRQDITKIKCDAIVNPTNEDLFPSGGTDAAIHAAAGPALYEACQEIGHLDVGEVAFTQGYNLPCKYVIYTVGPVWEDGTRGERTLLENCYRNALLLALEKGCKSIAFPLISAGLYGFPKDQVLKIAIATISDFLFEHELQVRSLKMKFICYPKCTTCQKARAWLDTHAIKYEQRDIKLDNPTPAELTLWYKKSGLPLKKFFNTSGLLYKSLDLKSKLPTMSEEEMLALLATDGMLVKRPILVGDDFVLVGFKETEWENKILK